MKFPLAQLYQLNRVKPIVEVEGIDGELQWDECDLIGLPPERIEISFTSQGKIPKGQWDNLPRTFKGMNGGEYFIEHITVMK
jgi:hypothetical protein